MIQNTEFMNNTVILNLTLHKPGQSKKVRKDQVKVIANNDDLDLQAEDEEINQDRISVSKKVLQSPELKAIVDHFGVVKRYVEREAMPADTLKAGMHLLRATKIARVANQLEQYAADLIPLKEDLERAYPRMQEESYEELGSIVSPLDFPPIEKVLDKISITWNFLTFTTPTAVLRSISAELAEEEERKIFEHTRSVKEQLETAAAVAFQKHISHFAESLKPTKDGKLRKINDVAVTRYNEYFRNLLADNVTGNVRLADLIQQATELMNGATPEELSTNRGVREAVALGMERVMNELSQLTVSQTDRMIFLPPEEEEEVTIEELGGEDASASL